MRKKHNQIKVKSVIESWKTINGAVLYLLAIENAKGGTGECVMRLGQGLGIGYIESSDKNKVELEKIVFERKRTLQASVREFIRRDDRGFLEDKRGRLIYNKLWAIDSNEKEADERSKRKWRIHEVRSWKDGFFVARLSCAKLEKRDFRDTQYIIHPSRRQDPKSPWLLVHSTHDTWTDKAKIEERTFKQGLKYQQTWHQLGEALKYIDRGYSTEREAIFGFEKVCERHDEGNGTSWTFEVANSVRQVAIQKKIPISLIDHYLNGRNRQAWLFESNGDHFIMNESDMSKGVMELKGTALRSPLDDPENTARHLLSLYKKKDYHRPTRTRDEAIANWKELIREDLLSRYRSCMFKGDTIITDIAVDRSKNKWVVRASLVPNYERMDLPLCFVPLLNTGMIIEGHEQPKMFRLRDSERKAPHLSIGQEVKNKIDSLEGMIAGNADIESLEELYGYVRWKMSLEDAMGVDEQWKRESQDCDIHNFSNGVCFLPFSFHKAIRERAYEQSRQSVGIWSNDAEEREEAIKRFEASVSRANKYPKQMIQVAQELGLVSDDDARKIETHETQYSDVLRIDVNRNRVKSEHQIVIENSSNDSDAFLETENNFINCKELKEDKLDSDLVSKVGRPRIHKDDRERKRVWAKQKRIRDRERRKKEGEKTLKKGRKQVFSNGAERTRAYRLKQKLSKNVYAERAKNAGLIIVNWQKELKRDPVIHVGINQVVKHYLREEGQNRIIATTTIYDELKRDESNFLHDTDIESLKDKKASVLVHTAKRYQTNSSMIQDIGESGITEWHICGMDLATSAYSIGLLLLSEGLTPRFYDVLCQGEDDDEKRAFKKQIEKVFGIEALIK